MEPQADFRDTHLLPLPAAQPGPQGTSPKAYQSFSSDGICHTLAFPTLLLLTTSPGTAGSPLTKLTRM